MSVVMVHKDVAVHEMLNIFGKTTVGVVPGCAVGETAVCLGMLQTVIVPDFLWGWAPETTTWFETPRTVGTPEFVLIKGALNSAIHVSVLFWAWDCRLRGDASHIIAAICVSSGWQRDNGWGAVGEPV